MSLIGVISDTHGQLRAAVVRRLRGVDAILHAGDVGDAWILAELNRLAPTHAVRGNVDREPGVSDLPETAAHEIDGHWFYLLHDLGRLDLKPAVAGFSAVVSGHSHSPKVERREGVLYLNPGSCGPRRLQLPVSMALVRVDDGVVSAELIALDP
jgi:putative phosphoesterase